MNLDWPQDRLRDGRYFRAGDHLAGARVAVEPPAKIRPQRVWGLGP